MSIYIPCFSSLSRPKVTDKVIFITEENKILINKEGNVEETYASFTKPTSNKIINKIEEIL